MFATQWEALREYAHRKNIHLLGDLPMFVAHQSADVWASRSLFRLDEEGMPTVVAGVPPDYFSADGQRWGNPLYDWDRIGSGHFQWWIERVGVELTRFDALRLDHFRGLEACWEIPAGAPVARDGHWIQVPGAELLSALNKAFGALPLIAEDLGLITPAVIALRERFGLPGMRVLQFAFDGSPDNPHLPHHHVPHAVVYTGTHDNPPSAAWGDAMDPETRRRVSEYCGRESEPVSWMLILTALASVARLAVVPLQDWLGTGQESRINTPGTAGGNWMWRFDWAEIPADLPMRSSHWTRVFGR
ncbi:4-alpha-glucanotransferase [mine drainage metagenome]|uniref:4-alpha-glucanotransferase n=1 Tax=mine drainage metagenome TaxID=410659 RepID=T1BSH3_9ZZZZ